MNGIVKSGRAGSYFECQWAAFAFLPLLESVKVVHDASVATLPPSTSAQKTAVLVESCMLI